MEMKLSDTFTLLGFHPLSYTWYGGDGWHGSARLGSADFLFRKVTVDVEADVAVVIAQLGFPASAKRSDCPVVAEFDVLLETVPREAPVHSAGVDVGVA